MHFGSNQTKTWLLSEEKLQEPPPSKLCEISVPVEFHLGGALTYALCSPRLSTLGL